MEKKWIKNISRLLEEKSHSELQKSSVFRHISFVPLSSNYPKNPRSSERGFFYPLRKQWHIINDSVTIVVSHQSVRTVYHHALACIKNTFAMMIYKNFILMICNSCGIDDIQCSALIFHRFYAILHLRR